MKPDIYYENKNSYILNVAQNVRLQIPRAVNGNYNSLSNLKSDAIDFLALVPDETDDWTSDVWVSAWKTIYNRLSESIQEIKNLGDYKLDSRRKELSAIASALLGARRAVYWVK